MRHYAVMFRRNGGLLRQLDEDNNVGNMPGDPMYSPTNTVVQSPVQYGSRSEAPTMQQDPGQSPGSWTGPTTVNPAQYIDQNVGGMAGDTHRLGYTRGLSPFTQFRQPFTGTVLTPPRPATLVVGEVGRLGQRDNLAARVRASTTNYQPTPQAIANAMVNPQLGW